MRRKVAHGAFLQASRDDTFIICQNCVHVEEEESEDDDDGGDDDRGRSMPTWEIVLICVVSVVGAGFIGVLIWYLVKSRADKKKLVRLDEE